MTDTPHDKVTRFEVIDYTERTQMKGRVLSMRSVQVELSYQDDGRTLKVFITERPHEHEWVRRRDGRLCADCGKREFGDFGDKSGAKCECGSLDPCPVHG